MDVRRSCSVGLAAVFALLTTAISDADTFVYQGKLINSGAPESGPINFAFRLYDDALAGGQVGPELTVLGFADFGSGGEFTVDLDFGAGAFDGSSRWLEVWVNGAPLSPRQPIHATPYAMHATTAAAVVDGGLPGTYASAVDFSNAANQFAGDGSALVGLNASNIATGTLADARLSSNIPRLNSSTEFTGGTVSVAGPNATFRINSDADTFSTLDFNDTVGDGIGMIQYDHLNDEMLIGNFAQGMFSSMTLESNGDAIFSHRVGINGDTSISGVLGVTGGAFVLGALGIGTSNPQDELHVFGEQAALRLEDNDDPGSFTEIIDAQPTQLRINKTNSAGTVLLDLNPKPADGLGSAQVRFFRETDTTGPKAVQFLRGNDSTQASASIGVDGADSWLNIHGGNVGIGTATPTAQLNVVATGEAAIIATTDDQSSAAVFGENSVSPGFAAGVWGATSGSGCAGLYGTAGDGAGAYGVYGWAGSAATNYGVYGRTSSATGYGLYSLGRAHINGTLSKTGGAFRIDHPLDPKNKELWHSFVESPDMMNIYNGNVVTDGQGYAIVTMPDYFEALNRDFRYQLTVIGEFAQAIVAEEMLGNTFAIRTDNPFVKVSWQVTGIRHDPWAEANRIPNEVEKRDEDKGLYLSPEAYGLPREMGVDWRDAPELAPPAAAAMSDGSAQSEHTAGNELETQQ